jgi:hypothetical protein
MTDAEIGTAVERVEDQHSALVRLALEKNVGVDTIERLVALQERMAERDARASFFAALGRFQAECPPVQKSRTAKIVTKKGGTYAYQYASLDVIVAHIRPYLHRHGFSFTWDCEADAANVKATCYLKHVDGHVEHASFSAPTETDAAMSGAQKNGAALTFAQRRSLEQVTGIVTTDDTDAAMPVNTVKVTDEDVAILEEWITSTGSDRARFLAWLGVSSLSDLPAIHYDRALGALKAKTR